MITAAKPRELPEFVDDLVRIGTAELIAALGITEDEARAIMARIADGIVSEYARTTMYVPAGFGSRNSEIWRRYGEPGPAGTTAFSRARVAELAAESGLTDRQVYSILAVMRSAEMARRQLQLPGLDSAD